MKLKVQHVFDATLVVAQIIRENRPMPQRGKFYLARLHAKLLAEFTTISERRDAMIKAYDHHAMVPSTMIEEAARPADQFSVPADKMAEFSAAWTEIGNETIDVDVGPVPLSSLDMGDTVDGVIQAAELVTLGELVAE